MSLPDTRRLPNMAVRMTTNNPSTRPASSTHVLWYQQPATDWFASSPLGNGRIGACVFGGVATERLNLNEETLWSGGPRDTTNPEALENLPKIRQLIKEGKPDEAEKLTDEKFMGRPN